MCSFSDLGLPEALTQALSEIGFEKPTPVQEQAIPVALNCEEGMVVVAKTGTGKTAAFGLPLLARTQGGRRPSGLILAPTRELACQIADDLRKFSVHMPKTRVVTVYGGASISYQMNELDRGAAIVVATPGRLLDLANRGAVKLDQVEFLVLDEADEILRMGFQEELDQILKALPDNHRTWLYSATMPRGVMSIAQKFMQGHERIDVQSKEEVSLMEHVVYEIPPKAKYRSLVRLVDANPDMYGIVFCRTRRDVQSLHESLMGDEITSVALHGDLNQSQRDYVMNQFRQRRVTLLIATDIAARGIDVDQITHVMHFDLPESFEAYTHRSGRTARAGHTGRSLLLLEPRDRGRARRMANMLKIRFDVEELPKSNAVFAAQIDKLYERMVGSSEVEADLEDAMGIAMERFEGLSREDMIRNLCMQGLARYTRPFRRRDIIDSYAQGGDRGHARDSGRGERNEGDRPRRDARPQNDRNERPSREDFAPRQARGDRYDRGERPQRPRRDDFSQRDAGGRGDRPQRPRRDDFSQRPGREDFRADRPQRDVQSVRETPRRTQRVDQAARREDRVAARAARPEVAPLRPGQPQRITVNAGSKNGLQADMLQGLLSKGSLGGEVSKIRIDGDVASFDVNSQHSDAALRAFKGFKLDGKRVSARKHAG
jgi:ATP-dependent RNA helicase DeaD